METEEDPTDYPVCTCKPECPSDCKGQCGCERCHIDWQDYLSDPEP